MDSSNEKGRLWEMCDEYHALDLAQELREAMHDRDRFERDAAWWREQALSVDTPPEAV